MADVMPLRHPARPTLLSILGCPLTPTEGSVRIRGTAGDGADPEQLTEIRRRYVGSAFQNYRVFAP